MASKEKVQEMLVAIDFEKQQKVMVEQMFGSMRTHFADKEDQLGVEAVNVHEKAQVMILKRVGKFVEKIYEEIFTDEEVDEMIHIFSSPAFKRLQAMSPEIMQRTMNYVMESMDELQEELESMYEEAAEKMTALEDKTEV